MKVYAWSLFALAILSIMVLPVNHEATITQSLPLLTMVNSTHGNALGGKIQVTALGNNCYFPIQVNDTITFNGNATYTINLSSFFLTTITYSQTVSNTTNFIVQNPNNRINSFLMLSAPNDVNVLEITFAKTCLSGSLIQASLIYNDGVNNFMLI